MLSVVLLVLAAAQAPAPARPVQSPLSLACEQTPRGWAALTSLSESVGAGRLGAAQQSPEQQLAAAVARDPDNPVPRLNLARCYDAKWQLANADRTLTEALDLLRKAAAETPASPPAVQRPGAPLRVGGDIPKPAKLQNVVPQYPDIARASGVSGIVILDAVIDPQGNVTDIRIVGSVPELDAAAVRAVAGWKYAPTIVDGKPVSVSTPLFVGFGVQAEISTGDLIDVARFYAERTQYEDATAAAAQALQMIRRDAAAIAETSKPGVEVVPPAKVRDVKPEYPAEARGARLSGTVMIEALIDQQGIVRRARIARSAAPELDQAALEAVSQWRYQPARLNGQPVGVRMTVSVTLTP